ncbi:MAG: long-chain fatty acid--CoA ligase [Balneolaceae bacterium]
MKESPSTIPELIEEGLNLYESGTPVIFTKRGGEWIETEIDSLRNKIRQFAMGLYALGVRPGDTVSIHSENSTEWIICDQAVLSIGAANVPIYTTQPADQIRYILGNSGSKVHIVSNDQMFADTKPMIKEVESIRSIITLSDSRHKQLKTFEKVLEMGRKQIEETPDLFDELRSDVRPDDLATLIYTSGTTGMPKGVMLSHNNIASNVKASLERVPFTMEEIRGADVLTYLPLSHVFERLISYVYLVMGARIHYVEDVDEIREDFLHVRPFFFATVPRLLEKIQTGVKVKGQEFSGLKKKLYYWALYRAEKYDPENPSGGILDRSLQKIADLLVYSNIRELFGGNLRGMISGGASLSPSVFRFINALGVYCGQGYGLTETSPVIAVQDRNHMRVGSSGLPLSNVEVKIAEDNEILTRGPNVMLGYYQQPEMTEEVMAGDGWLKTGDVGKIDEDGYLYITDRKKSMFKLSTGKYVAPQNIENQLVNSGYIEQAVVIGYQRKFCSALIVPNYDNVKKRLMRDGYRPSKPYGEDERVRKLIREEVDKTKKKLSPWETVKKFVLLEAALSVEEGELTPTHKVKRSVVNEKFSKEIESMYEEEKENEGSNQHE